jgi:hypothetical protein
MGPAEEGSMPRYEAFLLRIWRSEGGMGEHWALRLEHLPSGQSLRFHTLESLLAYLNGLFDPGARFAPDPAPDAPVAKDDQ